MIGLRKKFIITLGIVVIGEALLGGLFFYFRNNVIIPRTNTFMDTNQSIARAEKSIAEYDTVIEPALDRNAGFLSNLEGLFFSPDRGIEFIRFLERVVERNRLTHTITVPPSKESLQASFRVEGEYADVIRFLREIEREQFLLTIEEVSLQRRPGSAVAAIVQATLATP